MRQLPRPGRVGDFHPTAESTNIRVKWRVRQCRRLRTFRGGLCKFLAQATPCERLLQQLFNEWEAILRAKGYGLSFRTWVLQWPFVSVFPVDFPSLAWVDEILQLLQFDCEALAAHESRCTRNQKAFQVQQDITECSSRQGFKALRGPSRPPFSAVTTQVVQQCSAIRSLGPSRSLLAVPSPLQFKVGLDVHLGACTVGVLEASARGLTVAADAPTIPPFSEVIQEQVDCTPDELHQGFFDFWAPFWNRDSPENSVLDSSWQDFAQILDRFPAPWPEAPIDMLDLTVWRAVLRKSSSRSATGACGFAVAELKQLSDTALMQFALLCHKALTHGFPRCMIQGRVNVLAKVDSPSGYGDGRPILPATYRLWSSVAPCQQVSRVASQGGPLQTSHMTFSWLLKPP